MSRPFKRLSVGCLLIAASALQNCGSGSKFGLRIPSDAGAPSASGQGNAGAPTTDGGDNSVTQTGGTNPDGGIATVGEGGRNAPNEGGIGGDDVEQSVAGAGGTEESSPCTKVQSFENDAHNCGTCEHDCLGSECTLGRCQPIEMARNQGHLFAITVDDNFVYWGGDNTVVGKKRLDNSGKVDELVAVAGQEYVYDIVVVGQTLYWGNDWKDNGVRGCALPTCGNGPLGLISGTTPLRDIIFDGANSALYYTQGASVWQKPLPAGTATQLSPAINPAVELATDGAFVYWSEYIDKTSTIRRADLQGKKVGLIASKGLAFVNDMSVMDGALYVLEYPRNGGIDRDARVLKIAVPAGAGAKEPPLFASAGLGAEKIAVDASGAYWTQQDRDPYGPDHLCTIRHCPLSGCVGEPTVLAETDQPWGITTDERAIYWATETGQVFKLAK